MVKEIYVDMDDTTLERIMSDIDLFRGVRPSLKYKIYKSSPDKNNYHLAIYNIDIPFHVAIDLLRRTCVDLSYLALVQHKREFFRRNSFRYTSDGEVTPPPVLIQEG